MKAKGIRKTILRTKCRKGIHKLTPLNRGKGGRCLECRRVSKLRYYRRFHKGKNPSDTGKCGNGLHDWVPENVFEDTKGYQRCRLCRRESAKQYYHKNKVLRGRLPKTGIRRIMCIVSKCASNSKNNHQNYICPEHRKNPPSWIAAAGLVIRGTEVVCDL